MGEGREDFAGDFFGGRREGTTECGVKGAPSGRRIFYALFFARAAVVSLQNLAHNCGRVIDSALPNARASYFPVGRADHPWSAGG